MRGALALDVGLGAKASLELTDALRRREAIHDRHHHIHQHHVKRLAPLVRLGEHSHCLGAVLSLDHCSVPHGGEVLRANLPIEQVVVDHEAAQGMERSPARL